ncbi:MAG: LysM domain-containing protein [Chthoniobacteraceae bacterium]
MFTSAGEFLRCSGEHANTFRMSRFFGVANVVTAVFLIAPGAWAQDSAAIEEVRGLRALVEKQSKQIDALTEQIAKLRIALEKAGDVPLAGGTAAPVAAPAVPSATAPAAEFSLDAPKAEPADGKRHVVIKGETLTSIAKHYNLPVSDLKKANKDVDERKLQIGQTLTIPTPKGAEAPVKKEENN